MIYGLVSNSISSNGNMKEMKNSVNQNKNWPIKRGNQIVKIDFISVASK